MRQERTEAARIAKKVKAAKNNWTGKKRTSSHAGTLPSLKSLRNSKMTPHDMTLDQQFIPLDSDSESENDCTVNQSMISIPVPQDLLSKFGSATNEEKPQ